MRGRKKERMNGRENGRGRERRKGAGREGGREGGRDGERGRWLGERGTYQLLAQRELGLRETLIVVSRRHSACRAQE